MTDIVIAVDPGRSKCGVAVVSRSGGVLARVVVPTESLRDRVQSFYSQFSPQKMIIGGATSSTSAVRALSGILGDVEVVDETLSTIKARTRYFVDNPPRGLLRLIPRGLLLPPESYDDYAAVVLAEEFLARES